MILVYFFDSYALIEMLLGNENYRKYLNSFILTTKLNLFEVFYKLLNDVGEKEADFFLDEFYGTAIDFDKEIIKQAAWFKIQNKKRNLSMTDCIGYALACKWGIKFLTGDKEFTDLENVEFVK